MCGNARELRSKSLRVLRKKITGHFSPCNFTRLTFLLDI